MKNKSFLNATNIIIVSLMCVACLLTGTLTGMVAFGDREDSSTSIQTESTTGRADFVSSLTPSTPTVKPGEKMTKAEVYSLNIGAVVGIKIEGMSEYYGEMTPFSASGSGFVISSDGYIMTNNHVVEDATKITVIFADGRTYDATVVGTDSDGNDVGLIKIEATGLQTVTLATEDSFAVGDDVVVIGNPLGEMTFSLTSGSVSTLARTVTVDNDGLTLFQIDAAVNPGNSGGPVFDMYGRVIGIVTAKYSDTDVEGIGFAIPITVASASVNDIIEYGYVRGRPYFGISVTDYSTTQNGKPGFGTTVIKGAKVLSVDAESCADKAGLLVDDIITALDDVEITSVADLLAAKKSYSAGDTASIIVFRNGEFITLSITFVEAKS